MNGDYGTTTFVMDSGERYCLVIDKASGLPVFHPNLFITTQVRNTKSNSFSSVSSAAISLVVLLRFLYRRGIDLEQRVNSRTFFEVHELDDLRDFTQRKFLSSPIDDSVLSMFSLEELEEAEGFVESSTQYNRLTIIAEYLKWFSSHIISRPSATESKQIDAIETQIKSRRPSRKGRNNDKDRSIDDIQLDALFEVIRIGSEQNPFTAEVQRRNRLIVLLLYHLGLRGGELLNIKVSDIDFSKHQVKVLRRADEKDDPRVNEPNVKTLERTLPVSETLSKELHDYVTTDRRRVINAKRNNFLFVTHKSGPTVGQPISKSGYHKVMAVVKSVSPKLYALTGHKLRHTWNRKFSELMDSMDNPPSEERQEQIRSYLMGWKPGSGSAAHYNKRFRQEQANKAALALQKSSGTRLPKDLRNDE
ncbi:Tyrosine-based site-specific recombinase CMGI-7 [Pectobacterium brasiliense]|uniref:site-specific integrase n=1 Tax=Pectobacterium brasiliense TaxID=180957 RepID=UPI000CE690A1|nr:site-specific integrase [Pectobacterium brasiliense]PPE59278.1 Tyrosine-based site-specific recombinase CMGI-7 [Pectobacterium brasiliense]